MYSLVPLVECVPATMRGFPCHRPNQFSPWRSGTLQAGGTTAEAYKRSKGSNTVTCTALALKLIVANYKMSQMFLET